MNDITLLHGDCLALMQDIPDGSIDCIITDLPYGTTQNSWDVLIEWEPLWEQYKRVIKPNGAIVLFGSQPFTSDIVNSNKEWFKYCWVWEKSSVTGHLNAHIMPMKIHEDVVVFSDGKHTYNPQDLKPFNKIAKRGHNGTNFGDAGNENFQEFTNYPRSILRFKNDSNPIHPTQKPVKLIEYLIRTYSNEGETILDNTAGSMTTAIAAINTNRKCICMEMDDENFRKGSERVRNHQKEVESIKNTSLFDFMV